MTTAATVEIQGSSNVGAVIANDMAKAKSGLTDFEKQGQRTASAGVDMGKALDSLGGALGALGFAASIAGAAALTTELYNMGAAANRARDGLNEMTGGRADEWMDKMVKATHGLIDDEDAAAIATKLLATNMTHGADETAKMIRAATILGARFGNLGAKEASEQLANMLNQMNTRGLKEFGINIEQLKTRMDSLKKSNKELTDQQAFAMAFWEQATPLADKMSGILDDQVSSAQKLTTAWDNLKESLGSAVADGMQPAVDKTTNIINNFNDWLSTTQSVQAAEHKLQLQAAASADTYLEYAAAARELNIANYGGVSTFQDLKKEIQDNSSAALEHTEALRRQSAAEREAALAAAEQAKAEQLATDMNRQASLQLDILSGSLQKVMADGAGMSEIFNLGAGSLKNYDLTAQQTLALYEQLGIATGELTKTQIDQSAALNQLNNLWVAGLIGADQYADAIKNMQSGLDANKISLDAQGEAIRTLAQSYINEGVPAYQAMARATKEVESSAQGTQLTLDQAKTKISELSEVVAQAAKIKPADITINSNAVPVAEGITGVSDVWKELMASATPIDVKVLDGTVPPATTDIAHANEVIALLTDKTVTVMVNYVQTGTPPQTGGGGTPGGATGGVVNGYADGTLNFPGGIGKVGEVGEELVHLPKGTHIYSHAETEAMLKAAQKPNQVKGGDTNYNLTIYTNAPVEPLEADFALLKAMA